MARKVSIDGLADAVMEELNNYADTTADGVKAAVKNHSVSELHGLKFECRSGMLFITLPSGRRLAYVKPRIGENKFGGESVTYEGVGGTKYASAGKISIDVQLENELVQQAVDASDCDIPDAMIDDEIEMMLREMKLRMMYQGLRFEDYMKYTGQTEDQVKEMYRPEAKNRVKMQLVLEAMVKAENVEPTEEEVEKAIAEEAERSGREVEDFKKSLNDRQKEYLRDNAAIRKVVDMIVASAQVEEKEEGERIDAAETLKAVEDAAEALDEKESDEE